MARALVVIVGLCVLLASCTQKVICPAYQSAYIYDKEELRKKFSYFKPDSTPKIYTASKNKYLIADPVPYKKKVRSLNTVPMKPVNPVVPDSLKEGANDTLGEDISDVERNVNDSTAVIRIDTLDAQPTAQDSIYVISKDREVRVLKYNAYNRKYYVDTVGFNTQQDNYMWYLREVLVLPDARLAQMQGEEGGGTGGGEGKAKKEKKGFKGFFKNLFRKKDRSQALPDSTETGTPVEEEDYGYDDFEGKAKDSTAVQEQTQQPVKSKKKKLSLFKRNKPAKAKKETPPPNPPRKEDDDDGF